MLRSHEDAFQRLPDTEEPHLIFGRVRGLAPRDPVELTQSGSIIWSYKGVTVLKCDCVIDTVNVKDHGNLALLGLASGALRLATAS